MPNLSAFLDVCVVTVIGARVTNFPLKTHACVNCGSIQATAAFFIKDKNINETFK